jgi:2-polyprenyl-3-methyl-5-hydroxy-6-metoxy-1,4-benzoquinol methylase
VVSEALSRLGFAVTASDIPEFIGNLRLQALYRARGIDTLAVNLRDYQIPLADESYDAVIMCETLEHLNYNPLPVLLEINRILRPGGIFYASMPNLTSLINRMKMLLGHSIHNSIQDFEKQLSGQHNMIVGIHWREYTKQEAAEMLRYSGFELMQHDFFSLRASLAGMFIYTFCKSLRPYQKIISRKKHRVQKEFTFHPAAR